MPNTKDLIGGIDKRVELGIEKLRSEQGVVTARVRAVTYAGIDVQIDGSGKYITGLPVLDGMELQAGDDVLLAKTARGGWSLIGSTRTPARAPTLPAPGQGGSSVFAGNGLTGGGALSCTLNVGAGDGIAVSADAVAANINPSAGLKFSGGMIEVAIDPAGGLTLAGGSLDLVFGGGTPVSIEPDDAGLTGSSRYAAHADHQHAIAAAAPISVNLSANAEGSATSFARSDHQHQLDVSINPTWSSLHTFNAGLQVAAGQPLQFGADVALDRVAANVLRLAAGDTFRSSTYASGISGWAIEANGNAEFNNVRVRGSLHATVFVKDLIEARAGSEIIVKSAGALASNMTVPTSGTWAMTIEDPPGGGFLFENSDNCRCKTEYSGGIADIWFVVSSRTDNGNGTQSYTCTYAHGDRSVQRTYPAGAPVLDYGVVGDGGILLTADNGVGNAPFISIFDYIASPWSLTEHVRLGNLNGIGPYSSDTYGIFIGDYANDRWMSYDASGLLRIHGNGLIDGTVIADKLQVGIGTGNLCPGTDFSDDPAGDDLIPDGWTADQNGTNYYCGVFEDTNGTYTGIRGKKCFYGNITSPAGTESIQLYSTDAIPVDTNLTYVLSTWARGVSTGVRNYFGVRCYDSTGAHLGYRYPVLSNYTLPGTPAFYWDTISGEGLGANQFYTGTKYVRIVYWMPYQAPTTSGAFVWDCQFAVGDHPSAWSPSQVGYVSIDSNRVSVLDSSGARVFVGKDGSDFGIFGLNSSGTRQFYLKASDGKAYAGGGNVTLDSNGLTISVGSGFSRTRSVAFSGGVGMQYIYGVQAADVATLTLEAYASGTRVEIVHDTAMGVHWVKVNADLRLGNGLTVGYESADPANGEIRIYRGSTWMGQFSHNDTSWFRINNDVAKNIYTPRGLRVDDGIAVGNISITSGYIKAVTGVSGGLPFCVYTTLPSNIGSAQADVFLATIPRDGVIRSGRIRVNVSTTNNASNYWTISFITVGGTIWAPTTASGSPSVWIDLSNTSLSYSLSASSNQYVLVRVSKTGNPGNIYLAGPWMYLQ